MFSIPGYKVSEELYNGSRTLVYRGYREIDSLPVVIKLLKNPYPSFSELVQFRNQYTIAKNLNSPLIIQTYSSEPYQNGYSLVMEDFGGISLKEWRVGENLQSLQEFLEIAIALCNTLDILYRECIIHKDIKPSNILINPETKQVKLIDFSIASLLPRETQILINPNVLEGTLAYISPEQTGRMNRGIDYRTDFYSLGVTFYELLTGELPFTANDAMELVHCHIAKPVPNLGEKGRDIPQVLGDIVMKLMAKNAEDRYQSALGLKFDLEKCLHQLKETSEIKSFSIAQRDVCDRFIIPDKLYGRETEVQTLLQSFERVSLGATEMMLVAGFSGIGKTAVINEVHKPIVRQRGYFIKGKYDQFQRNIPFSAFVQAFQDLMAQLLSESDPQLQTWKTKIMQAVGDSGQVLIDVIPELERIIGTQPRAIELSGMAAQNRFNLLMQKFVQVFTSIEHPLVIFLDDLQWADSASLKLLQLLMAETGHLLVLGAYRDNEVTNAHPFILTVEEIVKTGATVNTISLQPLSLVDINQLVADTLNCELSITQPLTELVYRKTQGNPFFATQFLKALHEDEHITFDFETQYWQCDIAQVKALAITDDVVKFMAVQLQKLPLLTQNILKLAACIGAQFDLNTLAIVSEQSREDAATALWKSLQEGLIIPNTEIYKFFTQSDTASVSQVAANPTYRFLHDRVQQAAYSLIPDDQKQTTHLSIGQLLHDNISETELENHIFEIVNHWNRAIALVLDSANKDRLAQLNSIAGRKAKASSAYEPALKYFNTGLTLLSLATWQTQPNLTLALHEGAAEAACLCGNFPEMEQRVSEILAQTLNPLDHVTAYEIQIDAYTSQNRLQEAIAIALVALKQCHIYLPEQPTQAGIATVMEEVAHLLHNKTTHDLLNLPEMTEAESLAAMQLLSSLMPVAHVSAPLLLPFVVLASVKLSLQKGNTALSAHTYSCYGALLDRLTEDIDAVYKFGQLGLQIVENLNARHIQSKVSFVVATFITHCKSHFRESLPLYREAFQVGLEVGDIVHAGYSVAWFYQSAYLSGQHLGTLVSEAEPYITTLLKLNLVTASNYSHLALAAIQRLQGTQSQTDLDAQTAQLHTTLTAANDLTGLHFYWVYHLTAFYLFNEIAQAVQAADEARQTLAAGSGFITIPTFYFYDSLTALAAYPEAADKAVLLDRVFANQTKLYHRSGHAPMNFQHKYDLVEAERCRVLGNKTEAIDLYDRAISLARANDYIQEAALANELAAKFYLDWGKERIAGEYMIEAYYGYAHWGAKAKVVDLETRYPQLLAPILQQDRTAISISETLFAVGTVTATSSSSSICDSLDLAAILKASQTLSSEIELSKLLSTLLHTVIQAAGANKCVLMLLEDEQLNVQAIAALTATHQIEAEVLLAPVPVQDSHEIPISLINSVKRSLQPAVIVDAAVHSQFVSDGYIHTRSIKSILCSPILHQGKLLGVVYLENNLVTGAFTKDRVELLNLLSAQAAISLENARLYRQSQHYAQQLERSLKGQELLYEVVSDIRRSLNVETIFTVVTQRVRQTLNADRVGIYQFDLASAFNEGEMIAEAVLPEFPSALQVRVQDHCFGERYAEFYQQGRVYALADLERVEVEACYRAVLEQFAIKANLVAPILWRGDLWGLLCVHQCQHPRNWTTEEIQFTKQIAAQLSVALEQAKLLSQTHEQATELELTLTDLQNAQLQIVQSEKMSALGNLVAGVAHEINNPVGFIAGNLQPALDYVKDTFGLLDLYQQTYPNPGIEIQAEIEAINLDYVREDLPKLIGSMKLGVDRICSISTSLRTFSRADKDYKVPFNIHEGIDSTILILKHRLKANEQRPVIEVAINYGNLAQVECFPGQLNQVFMNILANAIDALDESNIGRSFAEIQANPNRITITTSVADRFVKIAIADNGNGMNESVKQKIFDHLFTTKAVGKGTGLGLAIARQIIESTHSGKLICNSVMGEGTEFVIEIPV